jgi:hypothetical protein
VNSQSLLRYAWYVLVGGMLLICCLPARGWLYQFMVPYYESMWARFFVYTFATSIPFVVWLRRDYIVYSFGLVVLAAVFEILGVLAVGRGGHQVDVLAELYGIVAGILLGLNLRRMRASALKSVQFTQKQDRSPIT